MNYEMKDSELSFWEQIRHSSEKAAKVTSALSGLMSNVGGPTSSKRRLLMPVTNATLLYGCEVWADALRKEKCQKQMASVQRRGALRIACSYRKVSEPAVLVVAGVIPIYLMVQVRKVAYDLREVLGTSEAKVAARDHSI
ncbi:uncharacterized protein [Rhodnius prolixus]|uniref:uncharacterized protein n=1 Tax=Rhodnius prolixus TaxID=13249 RepID=UPI003D18A618